MIVIGAISLDIGDVLTLFHLIGREVKRYELSAHDAYSMPLLCGKAGTYEVREVINPIEMEVARKLRFSTT